MNRRAAQRMICAATPVLAIDLVSVALLPDAGVVWVVLMTWVVADPTDWANSSFSGTPVHAIECSGIRLALPIPVEPPPGYESTAP